MRPGEARRGASVVPSRARVREKGLEGEEGWNVWCLSIWVGLVLVARVSCDWGEYRCIWVPVCTGVRGHPPTPPPWVATAHGIDGVHTGCEIGVTHRTSLRLHTRRTDWCGQALHGARRRCEAGKGQSGAARGGVGAEEVVRFLVRETRWLAREAQDAKRLLDLCEAQQLRASPCPPTDDARASAG